MKFALVRSPTLRCQPTRFLAWVLACFLRAIPVFVAFGGMGALTLLPQVSWADDDSDGDDSGSATAMGPTSPDAQGVGASSGSSPDYESPEMPLPVLAHLFMANEILAINPSQQAIRGAQALGLTVLERSAHMGLKLRLVRLGLPPVLDARTALDVLSEAFPQTFELHHLYQLAQSGPAQPCEGLRCSTWSLVGWPADTSGCGRRQVIGMIDTEVNVSHPGLKGADVRVMRSVSGGDPSPAIDHGTDIAHILVGQSPSAPGLVPRARLLAAAAFHQLASGAVVADTLALVKSLDWLVTQKAPVVGLSLAGPNNRALEAAVQSAVSGGTILFAAAGNGGPRAAPAFPAAFGSVLAVTAIDRNKNVYRRAQHGDYIDFAAPGVGIAASGQVDPVAWRNGTSFAVPFLVAMASQTIHNGRATPRGWQEGKVASLEDLGLEGRDPVFGWGLPRLGESCR